MGLAVVKILSSPPTASVRVDGVSRGRTPLKLELVAGRYVIALTSGEQTAEYVVEVTPEGGNKWCYDFAADVNRPGGC
jgi:hypothetical protein